MQIRQLNQDVSSGTPSLATNTLMATAGLISKPFFKSINKN
jgi:hypothetical protein